MISPSGKPRKPAQTLMGKSGPGDETRIRSCLAMAASGVTTEEAQARQQHLEAEAWKRHGIVIVRVDDDRIAWPTRELIQSLAVRRFGERRKAG